MSQYCITFSPTGGTERAAAIIAEKLMGEYIKTDLLKDIEPMELSAEDICLVAVPSFGGRVPNIAVDRLKKISANGARAVLLCVYGNRHWDDTLTELQDTLESAGFVCAAAVAAVAEHSIFRQFAAGRPDAEDKAQLEEFALQIKKKLALGDADRPILEGKHGEYISYNGVPFKPKGNKNCGGCGICAVECPVGAIDMQNPKETDTDKCISCMRCVALCPQHARDFSAVVLKGAAVAMAPKLSGRKENFIFI